jgi:4-hydroxybenzoate polyprenyltransferase
MGRLRLAVDGTVGNRRLGSITRWRNWAHCKIAILIACLCYAMLSRPAIYPAIIGEAALLFAMFCCYAAFGYALNSFSDIRVDAEAVKYNAFSRMSRRKAVATIALISAIAVVAGAVASANYWRADVAVLIAAAYLLAICYSLPPARLKEHGFLGVAASTLAQHTIPAAIVFTAVGTWDRVSLSLCVLSTMIGIRYILIHQMRDERDDICSNIRTVAVVHGGDLVRDAIKGIVFPLELAALVATVAFLAPAFPAILVAAGASILLDTLRRRFDDTAPPPRAECYATLAGFYYFYLPVILAAYVSLRDPSFWPVLCFALLWTASRLEAEVDLLVKVGRRLKRNLKRRRKSK